MGIKVKEIRNALQQAVNKAGSQSELSRQTGISQKNISRWLSCQVDSINDVLWEKLYPYVKSYLPEDCKNDTRPPSQDYLTAQLLNIFQKQDTETKFTTFCILKSIIDMPPEHQSYLRLILNRFPELAPKQIPTLLSFLETLVEEKKESVSSGS